MIRRAAEKVSACSSKSRQRPVPDGGCCAVAMVAPSSTTAIAS
jgi:hypothetical protein